MYNVHFLTFVVLTFCQIWQIYDGDTKAFSLCGLWSGVWPQTAWWPTEMTCSAKIYFITVIKTKIIVYLRINDYSHRTKKFWNLSINFNCQKWTRSSQFDIDNYTMKKTLNVTRRFGLPSGNRKSEKQLAERVKLKNIRTYL